MNVADNYADLYLTSLADTLQAEGFIASLEIPTATDAFVSTSTQLSLDLTSHEDSLLVSGAVREGLDMRHRRMPFVDPPLYLGLWLREGLRKQGIEVLTPTTLLRDSIGGAIDTLGVYSSLRADTLIRITNCRSANVYAEAMAYVLNDSLQRKSSLPVAVRDYWQKRLQLPESQFTPMDGSGLSPHGRLSSQALSLVLRALWEDKELHAPFLASLPEVGKEGTVRRLQIHPSITAYMKSGSIRGVRGYAGYVRWKEHWYSLVFMAGGLRDTSEARGSFARFVSELFVAPPPAKYHRGKAVKRGKAKQRTLRRRKR